MARESFSLNCLASSRGAYVRRAHKKYIKKWHKENENVVLNISATIVVKPKYYVKCFGHLQRVTEREAAMLGPSLVITM